MLRRILVVTMIGALALTSGCTFHNPFAKKAEPVTYESVVQSELSPEEKVDKLVAKYVRRGQGGPIVDDWHSRHNLE